ncbi:MAG: hypothetical protein P4L79_07780 [Legionella sp.]|nr:hypothetical protein [Legionella sp.]
MEPEKYKGDFGTVIKLLEKFKFEKEDAEMDAALNSLKSGEATQGQINMALGQIKSLRSRLDSRTTQPWRILPNEAELPKYTNEMNEAIAQLEGIMGQIRTANGSTDIIENQE